MTNTSREQVEWRRSKVQELAVKGYRQSEIVQMLQINASTICKDISFLREQSIKTIKDHLQDKLPYEYGKCLQGIEEIIKESWIVATKADKSGDGKEKLQSLALIKECYSTKMELLTNAGLLNESIRFVENTKERLSKVNNGNGLERPPEVNTEQSTTEPVF